MTESVIKSFDDLYQMSQAYRKGRWVFRGQSQVDYLLLPRIGRAEMETRNEQRVLDFFKREATAYIDRSLDSDWNWLAMANHHGLPTRLLDWTTNPLVAAYFAAESEHESDGVLYMLNTIHVVKEDQMAPFEIEHVMRYRPSHITRRISAQRGLFTIHPEPEEPMELMQSSSTKFHKAIIHRSFKNKLLWNLSRFNVNRASLFPGLDGLALHITWAFSETDPSEESYADGT